MTDDIAADTETSDDAAAEFDYETTVFQVPELVRDAPRYVSIHGQMVSRLRQEASGLEMTTLQTILIERIANGYVLMRWHEDNPGHWIGVNTEKDFKLNWRALVTEFNKILASGEDQRRDALRLKHQDIMLEGLALIEDKANRAQVRAFYMDQFSAIGE